MKHMLKTLLLTTLFSQAVYAASCDIDKNQMYDQISQYQSISTTGCPFNVYGWGITQVRDVTNTVLGGACSATCFYAKGPGSQGVKCSWEKGNWGDTLTCKG